MRYYMIVIVIVIENVNVNVCIYDDALCNLRTKLY